MPCGVGLAQVAKVPLGGAHAEPEAPTRQFVDGGRFHGDQRRVAVEGVDDAYAEADGLVTPAMAASSLNTPRPWPFSLPHTSP